MHQSIPGASLPTPGPPPFSRCSYVHPYPNITKHGGFYWKHKQIQSSANLKRERLVKVFKGMFSQFYACFSLLIKPEVGSYRHESTHFFGYGMKLLLTQDLNKFSSDDISNSTTIYRISYSRTFLYFLMLLNYSGQITFNTVHQATQYSNEDKQQ